MCTQPSVISAAMQLGTKEVSLNKYRPTLLTKTELNDIEMLCRILNLGCRQDNQSGKRREQKIQIP